MLVLVKHDDLLRIISGFEAALHRSHRELGKDSQGNKVPQSSTMFENV